MPHTILNEHLQIQIDLPTENYNHSRFDWTGKIASVVFKGKTVSGTEFPDQAEDAFSGKGFYNEFGMEGALGYEEAKTGEWFHKIGIGLLKKTGGPYDFQQLYDIQPASFQVEADSRKIRMTCQAPKVNGYAYHLEKEISVQDRGFDIRYRLQNTGEKRIVTTEYNHNFICLDKRPIEKDYSLLFPFSLSLDVCDEVVNPEGLVKLDDETVQFEGNPLKPFFFRNLSGGETVAANWQVENSRIGIIISETGSFPTNSVNLWGWGHVVSPELFIKIDLPPGDTMEWSRDYQITEI